VPVSSIDVYFDFHLFFSAGSQEAYIEQVDLQTDKNKRKILQLQKENKEKRQKLKELLEVNEWIVTDPCPIDDRNTCTTNIHDMRSFD
jgi:cell division protein FtsB